MVPPSPTPPALLPPHLPNPDTQDIDENGVRAPRDGPSPERNSRRRGGLPIPPRVPCLPALPPPLTACPVLDSLDIVPRRGYFYRGVTPVGLGVPGRAAIVDSCARLGLARGRARTAPPWDPAPGGNAPLHCGGTLALQSSAGSGPASLGCRTRSGAQDSAGEALSRRIVLAPA